MQSPSRSFSRLPFRVRYHALRLAAASVDEDYDPYDPDNPFAGYDPQEELTQFEADHGISSK